MVIFFFLTHNILFFGLRPFGAFGACFRPLPQNVHKKYEMTATKPQKNNLTWSLEG